MKTRDAARESLRELKSMLKFKDEKDIEDEILRLEDEIQHNSLSLQEEKKVMDDIRKLKNSKGIVAEYTEKMQALSEDESTCKELNAAIKSVDVEITKIREEEDVHRAALNEQKKKEEVRGNDTQTLIKERDECRERSKEAYEKIKDLRASHDAEWQEFKAQEKLWRAQLQEEKARRREEYLKEKAQREAERAARAKELAPEPFYEEITMCEQLTAYLGKYAEDKPAQDASARNTQEGGPAALDGMKMLKKEDVADDPDAWMMGTGGKKKGKGKKGASKAAAPEKLVHTVDILNAFAALKIHVPVTAAEVPATLQEVEKQREKYLEKRKTAAENGNDVAEVAEQEPESSKPANKQQDKKAAQHAPPKLDDEASWPSMGGASATAEAVGKEPVQAEEEAAAEMEDAEIEEGEIEQDMPAIVKKTGDVAVSLTVDAGNVSLSITPN